MGNTVEAQVAPQNGFAVDTLVTSPSGPGGCPFFNYIAKNSVKAIRPFISRTQDPDHGVLTFVDNRDSLATCIPPSSSCFSSLYAAIVGANGLITSPILIQATSQGTNTLVSLNALADDNGYYIVFGDYTRLTSATIGFVSLDPRGTILTRRDLVTPQPVAYSSVRAMMLSNSRIAIVAQKVTQSSPNGNIVFMVIDTQGNSIMPERVLPIASSGPSDLRITADSQQGMTYIFYSARDSNAYLAAVDASGNVIYDALFGGNYKNPTDVAFSESRLHLAWSEMYSLFYSQRNAADGQVLPGISNTLLIDNGNSPSITIDGSIVYAFYAGRTFGFPNGYYVAQFDKQSGAPRGSRVLILPQPENGRRYYDSVSDSDSIFDRGRLSLILKGVVNSVEWNQLVEMHSVPAIVADPLQRGARTNIHVYFPLRPNLFVYLAVMFNWQPGIRLSDGRTLPINPADPLFGYSGAILGSQMLQLDNNGHAQTTVYTPSEAPQGISYSVAAIVYDPAAASPVIDFNTKQLTIPT